MKYFIGIDIGDKLNTVCILNTKGKVVEQTEIENTADELRSFFSHYRRSSVAIEACTHSLWINSVLVDLKMNVFVANPRKIPLISRNQSKTDRNDANLLARLVRSDPQLLYPVKTRDIDTQKDLVLLKTRTKLVQVRGDLIRHVRGVIKPFGVKLPDTVTADNFHSTVSEHLDNDLLKSMKGTISAIKELYKQIQSLDKKIDSLIKKKYPEALNLQTIPCVGPITALTFILIIGAPERFKKSRSVGPYFGLVPKRDQSGERDKALPVTKAGDSRMRSLLVNCSQHLLGRYGKDTQLRRYGLKIAGEQGNKIRKKKAVVAVSRKLVVMMHSMLKSGTAFRDLIKKTSNERITQGV